MDNRPVSDKIDNIVTPILRQVQVDISALKQDMGIVKESISRIDTLESKKNER